MDRCDIIIVCPQVLPHLHAEIISHTCSPILHLHETCSHPSCTHTYLQILQCVHWAQHTHKCVSSLPRLQNQPVTHKYVHSSTLPPALHCILAYTYINPNSFLNTTRTHKSWSPHNVRRHFADIYTHSSVFALTHSLHPRT